jgi:hypothetical protein
VAVGHHEQIGGEFPLVAFDDGAGRSWIRLAQGGLQFGEIGDEAGVADEVVDPELAVLLDQGPGLGQSTVQFVFRLFCDRDVDVVDPEGNRDHGEQGARHEDAVRERGEEPQEVQL